jgi:hypothetical protein
MVDRRRLMVDGLLTFFIITHYFRLTYATEQEAHIGLDGTDATKTFENSEKHGL